MFNQVLNGSRKLAILDMVESGNGDLIDIHAMNEMREKGFVDVKHIKTGRKGRPPLSYVVTGKGRSLCSLIERNEARAAGKK